MNKEQFEQLFFEEESNTLDFKKEQYSFIKSSEDEKAEILKDILGFSNAFRRTTAYILIGVDEVRGGKSKVVGLLKNDHLADHSLQQFVNHKTNKPIEFGYEAFEYEDKQVGIIKIELQQRPIYLIKDFGFLKAQQVYIRRGSSTNPTKPASSDEIARMGSTNVQSEASLIIRFADVDKDTIIGDKLNISSENCKMPDISEIPNYSTADAFFSLNAIVGPSNSNYYRDLANYQFSRLLFLPIRLVLSNIGEEYAKHVYAELKISILDELMVQQESDLPVEPVKNNLLRGEAGLARNLANIRTTSPGEVNFERSSRQLKLEIDFGDVQPGRDVYSDIFYIGSLESKDTCIKGMIYSENLPKPRSFELGNL